MCKGHITMWVFEVIVEMSVSLHPCRSKNKRTGRLQVLRVVQQQHYGVELLPGPIVGAQRDDEVVETVSRRLCRHYNQLILEAVCFGILKAAVCAALTDRQSERESVRFLQK